MAFTDSNQDLTQQNIDLVHGKALELSNDGDLLLSSRNLSEITKVISTSSAACPLKP